VEYLREAAGEATFRGLRVRTIPERELDRIAGGGNHQGIAAVLKAVEPTSLARLIDNAKSLNGILVLCEELADPQNLGAVLRVCECAGIVGVCLTERRSAGITATVRRASAGAAGLLPIATVKNAHHALEEMKREGIWIAGLDSGVGTVSLFEFDAPRPLAIVLGSEGEGMRELTKRTCDYLVHIPMYGLLSSLNVATACSAALFELRRQEFRSR